MAGHGIPRCFGKSPSSQHADPPRTASVPAVCKTSDPRDGHRPPFKFFPPGFTLFKPSAPALLLVGAKPSDWLDSPTLEGVCLIFPHDLFQTQPRMHAVRGIEVCDIRTTSHTCGGGGILDDGLAVSRNRFTARRWGCRETGPVLHE